MNAPQDVIQYQQHYSEQGFWQKIAQIVGSASKTVLRYALLVYYVAVADTTPARQKVMLFGALGYLILPVDLIPDFIPGLGFADDLVALKAAYDTVKNNVTPEIKARVEQKMQELLG